MKQTEAVRALTDEKLHTMNLMVEQERRNVESLRQDLAAASGASSTTNPSMANDQRQQELDQSVRRLTKLEEQLEGLKAGKVCNIISNFQTGQIFTASRCPIIKAVFICK